ncbi:MAG TPA: LysR family transcriptional regulator [Nitrospiraceae bacterium]|jgi:DNA-binding transcriptional LysR family regulator|nr:LysR family transcriptional regulator [Nitrospiraceae bacterium]
MDIHHLKVFASVFKNKSFSKASEELHLTQPTISDHIKALEEELNWRLFDRLGRMIMPTKEAEILYNRALEIIEKMDSLREVVGEFQKEITGELVVGASTIPGTYLMPAIIMAFKKKHPSTSFQLIISDSRGIVEKVSRHELLIGIVGAKLSSQQLRCLPFRDDELIVVTCPSLVKEALIPLRQFLEIPMVLREEGSGTRRETEKILESKGVSLDDIPVAGILGSTEAVKQAVKAGLGTAILSRLSVTDELKHGVLKEVKIKDIQMKRSFYLVTHKKRTLPFAYSILLEFIKAAS